MGERGVDIQLTEDGKKLFPYSIECKNQEAFKALVEAWKQAVYNAGEQSDVAALVVKINNHDPLIVLDFEGFLWLYRAFNELKSSLAQTTRKNNDHASSDPGQPRQA